MRRALALLLCLGLMLTLGCSSGDGEAAGGEMLTFTDDLGRQVTVARQPQRVAALLGSFADVWMLAGGSVCATADDAWDDFALPLGADVVCLGGTKNPNFELLLASRPDFVIASASTAKNLEWREPLEEAGIPVAYFEVSCFDDYLRMLEICTSLTGRVDLYESNGAALRAEIDAVRASMNFGENPPRVLFLRASAGYIRAKNSRGSILGEMLADLGCVNIADSDASLLENLSIESILLQNPDHIFIVQVGDDREAVIENLTSMMEENPAWQSLDAVRNGRVHDMDKRLFNLKPNARWAEAYEILAQILRTTE